MRNGPLEVYSSAESPRQPMRAFTVETAPNVAFDQSDGALLNIAKPFEVPEHRRLSLVALRHQVLELCSFRRDVDSLDVAIGLHVTADVEIVPVGHDVVDRHNARELFDVLEAVDR